ncbi:A-kinase anchor protein 6 isoform X2 [Podarcis raffonei]|uniref:A-kinase anchor protein 6 isoform X2 n=1 Tax=Podarcis raffonei TaxID=65483 RepID=UPI0023294F35|nr:A-kinase anchor protein 6 isoform X2 [Podarcis raffonei]
MTTRGGHCLMMPFLLGIRKNYGLALPKLAMEVALSPIRSQELDSVAADASPMVINMTPTTEQDGGEDAMKDIDSGQQYEKPPPLHTGADWKIVLHLPEIETWLRMTSERVRDLTYSVQQDSDSKHVDVHLVQLKDICEDISDHVEQIHALLETEFSLKLLSYSVNVIVDIHTVQLLWHQLRVSVLVLRERILQGLQDANGNYTRQTDILQAFSEETKEDRLDSLTEVDDSGQLTIKCSQNYLSLDCGITAFELSDYSPSEDFLGALGDMTSGQAKVKPFESWSCSEMEKDFPELIRSVGLLAVATDSIASKCNETINAKEIHLPMSTDHQEEGQSYKPSSTLSPELSLSHISGNLPLCKVSGPEDSVNSLDGKTVFELVKQELDPLTSDGAKSQQHPHSENSTPKRSIRDCFDYNEDSPTQPTVPKRGLFLKEDIFRTDMVINDIKNQISLMFKTEMSRSTPSLLDPPDRSKLCLALQAAYNNCPSSISQSCDCLHNISDQNLKYTIQNHLKENSIGLGKPSDNTRREKLRCKKSHDIPEEVASCRISRIGSNAASTNHLAKRGLAVLQNGIPFGSLQSIEGTESDSTSASSDPCKRQELNGQYCSERDHSASPAHSQVSGSSAGSDSAVSSSPILPRSQGKKAHSSSPSYVNTDSKAAGAWYGSDEYLALPSHLKQTEVLALKLENLTKLLPQKPQAETIQNIDDWELSEMNSDSELFPTYQIKKKHKRLGRVSPSSSSDIISSVGDSIESGPLSDILSDEELCTSSPSIKKYLEERPRKPSVTQPADKNDFSATNKSALIQQLMQDIQDQDNYEIIWEKMEGFVSKLDEFIHWLNEAMETTENWTPPKAETDSLKLYLETHLSFKLNVDSHCALKEAVVEEGRQLLDLIVSHKSGLKDMLQMIASQWKELQRQIKRQHSWILRALGIIKAEILATDVSAEDEEGTESPKAEVQLCYLEAQRDAVEQMSLKLYSEQYNSSSKRKEEFADMSKVHTVGSNGLLDFDSEYQELWDWLIDMESIVIDSHDLMMSEEQQLHLYKRYSVEMSIRHPKKMELLSKVEALKRSGVLLPSDLLEKVDSINEKWELLGKTLGEKVQDTMVGHSGLGARDLLSPESGSLVRQLEVRIKELKGWLRDTELFIFNSCLRQESEGTMNAEKQLQYFKSLCCEIKQRRRGVGSVLRLCQHLLNDQDTCNLNADHQSMQLIIVNLERRWEAIVMQAVQWQTRLQKKLAKHSESLNVIDPSLMELNGTNEDALEWDEMDISNTLISVNEEFSELDQELKQDDTKLNSPYEACGNNDCPKQEENPTVHENCLSSPSITASPGPQVYQVYSLHNVELSGENHISLMKKTSKSSTLTHLDTLKKHVNKNSLLSPTKHLPELMGRTTLTSPHNYMYHSGNVSRHSDSQNKTVNGSEAEAIQNPDVHLQNDTERKQDNSVTSISDSQLGNIVDVIKQNLKQTDGEIHFNFLNTSQSKSSNRAKSLGSIAQQGSEGSEELQQGKHNVFTFYDYSYLQGSKIKLPMIMKQSNSEKAHKQGSLLHGFYFDKVPLKSEHQPLEFKPLVSTDEIAFSTNLDDGDPKRCEFVEDLKKLSDPTNAKLCPTLSHSSSLDSLSVTNELFGSTVFRSGDGLHRSTSLESWLTPYKSNEDLFSCNGSGDLSGSSDSVGELSKRTLDLLNRLENIQSPLDQKIKRSISDITLQSTSQRMSLAGQLSLDIASSINEDSPASLTELSSSDDLSLCSEDIVLHRNKAPDSNASFRKHLSRSVADESDVNVSMIVNVSCTSACTDDEDDSDLLSSSTLTLTEEELGIKDEDDDSSIATDEDIYEDCNLISGLDYIKNELYTWIRPKFNLTKEKRKCNLDDEIQGCKNLRSNETLKAKDSLSIEKFLNDSIRKLSKNNGNSKNTSESHDESGTKRQMKNDGFQVSKDHFVDDMENGNVTITQESPKEEHIQISTAAMNVSPLSKGSENECCICEAFTDSSDDSHMDGKEPAQLSKISSSQKEYKKHIQFEGHSIIKPFTEFDSDMKSSDMALPKSLPNDQQSRTGISEHGGDCCASLKSNEAEGNASAGCSDSCCSCETAAFDKRNEEDCSVHNFVMEIIDMASTALKNKSQPESEPAVPHSLAQIREKVLEHSHRPIQLRKGDFYSYLSLSSHDSDCGEVTKYVEEKTSTPVPLDFAENIECFFEACPEDERVEQQGYLPDSEVEVKYEALDLTDEPKTSAECSGFSFLSEEMDISMPGSLSQMISDNLSYASESLSLDIPNECPVLNSFPNNSKENHLREPLEIARSEEGFASSIKASAEAIQLTPDHLKEKDVLHQDTKTLTCEENLLHLHKERHINTQR